MGNGSNVGWFSVHSDNREVYPKASVDCQMLNIERALPASLKLRDVFFLKGKRTASNFLERIQKTTCRFYTGINITLIRSAPKISEFSTIYCYTFGPYSIIVTVTVISIFLLGCNQIFRPILPFFYALIYKKVITFVMVQVCRAS